MGRWRHWEDFVGRDPCGSMKSMVLEQKEARAGLELLPNIGRAVGTGDGRVQKIEKCGWQGSRACLECLPSSWGQ